VWTSDCFCGNLYRSAFDVEGGEDDGVGVGGKDEYVTSGRSSLGLEALKLEA
jgi:hypothetical protein